MDKTTIRRDQQERRDDSLLLYSPSIFNPFPTITHIKTKKMVLIEDFFDSFCGRCGERCCIKRYTWKNHNEIQIQLVNYGARITSIKFPNLKGQIEDVLVGFDDLCGYEYYRDDKFGAVLGRSCSRIRDNFYSIDEYNFCLADAFEDYSFDRAIWKPYRQGSKVILSQIFKHMEQGHAGDLFVRITFELLTTNEFHIDIEAYTTLPTIVDISYKLYFNLCSHCSGSDHLKTHVVTINANNYTPNAKDGLPSGVIKSVLDTKYDFQIPKKLRNLLYSNKDGKICQNLCVNREDDSTTFVGNLWHPSSGRMLEIFSNQPGIELSILDTLKMSEKAKRTTKPEDDDIQHCILTENFTLFSKFLSRMNEEDFLTTDPDLYEVRPLLKLLCQELKASSAPTPLNTPTTNSYTEIPKSFQMEDERTVKFLLTPTQMSFLENMYTFVDNLKSSKDFSIFKRAISKLLYKDEVQTSTRISEKQVQSENLKTSEENQSIDEGTIEEEEEEEEEEFDRTEKLTVDSIGGESFGPAPLGKNESTYVKHGALSLQPQNYPNAINENNFPNCILRPGEVYKHKIIYKFWLKTSDVKKYTNKQRDKLETVCKQPKSILVNRKKSK